MRNFMGFVACLFLAISPVFAQTTKPSSAPATAAKSVTPIPNSAFPTPHSTYAVVVGISDYQDPAIPDLRFADKDAEAFANFLRSPAGGALDNDHLSVLTNQNATAGRVAEAMDWLLEQTKAADEVIIYFSGHGDVERKTVSQPGFLLCWDSPARVYMGGGTYSLAYLQEIVTTLSTQNKAKVVVITDACHAGKLAGSQIGGAQATTANLARQFANEVKILSCQPNEFSLEGEQWGGGRGCFSYHLVDALFGLADRNGDAFVSLGELDRYLEDHVTGEAAPQSQVPMLLGNKTERISVVNEQMLAVLKKNKAGGMPMFMATEGRGFEDEILARVDSSIREMYWAFKLAVKEKRFFPDQVKAGENKGNCADEYYAQLIQIEGLTPLYGFMKRNYAAALQDDAQQVLNTMLKTGLTEEVLRRARPAEIYREYPKCLSRAAELLSSGHYMYPALQARKIFFEGKIETSEKEKQQSFFKALEWQPDMPHALVELVVLFEGSKRDSAESFARKAMEITPNWTLPYLNLSRFYSTRLKDFKTAASLLDQAAAIDSSSELVWYSKGVFYELTGDLNMALQWYNKAISTSAGSFSFSVALSNLGDAYIQKGQFKEAETVLLRAVALDSTFMGTWNRLGKVYWSTERFEASKGAFFKELGLAKNERDKSNAYNELGNLNYVMNKIREAEYYYHKCMQTDSLNPNPYFNLSEIFIKRGEYELAVPYAEKLLRIDTTNGFFLMGMVALAAKNYSDAEKYTRRAVKAIPSNESYYYLAKTLSLIGKLDDAYEALEITLKQGYNYDFMQQDTDLAPLREQADRWQALMKKYFPDQVKE